MGQTAATASPRKMTLKDSMVLVPPLFDYPPAAARNRMSVPSYEVMFGKAPTAKSVFEDYFDQVGNTTSRIMLRALEDPRIEATATLCTPANEDFGTEIKGDALFHWQKYSDDPYTFMDLHVSTSNPWLIKSCVYSPEYGIGAFGTLPLLMGNRVRSEDYGVMGIRYGSENLSLGASFVPFPCGNKNPVPFTDPENWNCAISYSAGSTSPLSPSFIFMLELARSKQVQNPSEDKKVVEITNLDLGIEFTAMTDKDKSTENGNSQFQLAASWQANKNFLLKGKLGPSKSSIALALKSWWRPSVTFGITAFSKASFTLFQL
ncbi:hypothetical protein PR202_gb02209 [Eleusine coracana subsp. coracana]|uniref:Uncharacterized protein n=1 Tax=Eleusine coracana subsp. coracana TaxID=191504 RepID=A0AAV5DX57_ELECO|nr:hypothetical protein PR202_gb02209 [Eleusine coracana subsp. coracana]